MTSIPSSPPSVARARRFMLRSQVEWLESSWWRGGVGMVSEGTYGGLKISMSTECGRITDTRSAFMQSRKVVPEETALTEPLTSERAGLRVDSTVSDVALQANSLTSMPSASTLLVPRRVLAWAATKARTTPEPVPTSRTRGQVVLASRGSVGLKRCFRNATSESEDRVSRRKKESSAGSYTFLKETCDVDGVGIIGS